MRPSQRATAGSLLLPLCFLLIGLAFTLSNLRDVYDAQASMSWPQTDGAVLEAVVSQSTMGRHREIYYQPVVTFSYHVDGQWLTSSTIAFGGPLYFRDHAQAEAIIKRFAEGATVAVYHHPTDPRRAALMPGRYGTDLLPRMTFSVSLLLFNTILICKYRPWGSAESQPVRRRSPKAGSRHERPRTRRERKRQMQARH